jgi:putative acetyltransferase
MLSIRDEKPLDVSAIRKVHETAFNGVTEANLVDLLRATHKATISLVATIHDNVIGHIVFSPVTIESNPTNLRGMGLAPLAVLPDYQNRGIGSHLVTHGLDESRKRGYDLVVVLGDKKYYSRFGFKRASLYGLGNEYQADESFMALELREGVLNAVSGIVKYQPKFNEAGA